MVDHLQQLLKTVVEEYLATAAPVGSQRLVERYGLDMSSATVRNRFAELEQAGLVTQPHTSGGRIPTEKGFRRYVELFVKDKPAGKKETAALRQACELAAENGWQTKNLAKALSALAGQAVFVTTGQADTFYTGLSQLFAQPEFRDWQRVVSLSEVFDSLNETLQSLQEQDFPQPRVLLGRDCPFGAVCGAVVISFDDGLLGLLGPVRMDYQRAISLMSTVLQILNS